MTNENNDISTRSGSPGFKRRRVRTKKSTNNNNPCLPIRAEEIHQALTKMIALNQMPISFCSSEGFLQFMAIVEPNYKPIKEDALKKMLHALKNSVEDSIKANLNKACGVACTSDCWSSAAQESYITMTVHLIDDNWIPRSFTLDTTEMDKRHTSENLANKMENTIFKKWKLNGKIKAIVTDNAANVVKAVQSTEQVQEKSDVTCAVHSLQLTVNKSLHSEDI